MSFVNKYIIKFVPDLFNYHTLLYVGLALKWNYPFFRGQDGFDNANYEIDIIEVWPKYVEDLKKFNEHGKKFKNAYVGPGSFRNIILGDVRQANKLTDLKYDVVMWWHGPEHVREKDWKPTLDILSNMTEKILLLCIPSKEQKRGPENENPYEAHLSTGSSKIFENLGFTTTLIGDSREYILGWKRKNVI